MSKNEQRELRISSDHSKPITITIVEHESLSIFNHFVHYFSSQTILMHTSMDMTIVWST